MPATADAGWRPRANPWLIAIVVTSAAFMEILDTTIVNVSLPHIAGSVSASYDDATWTVTSYLVANGIVLPVSGWLGRLIGRKRYFMLCIAMFTVCSLLCGIATSLPQLVVFRLAQGLFGGGLQPSQQAIILDNFEPSQRGRAFSVVAVAVIFAPIIGPTLGGLITDNYSWRWIFLINVPVGALALIFVARLVEDPPGVKRDRAHLGDIDGIGLGLIALGFGSLQFMLDRGEDSDWFASPSIRIFGVLAAVGLVGAVIWLLTTPKPVVDLHVLADRNFAVGSIMITCTGAILYSTNVLIPQLAQEHLGYTALWAGLLLSPGAFLMLLLIPVVAKLALPHFQTRHLIGFGFFALSASLAYAHFVTPQMDFWGLALMRAFQTVGLAFLFVPNSTLSYATLPRSLNGDATALYSMFRNIGGSVGIAVATSQIAQTTQQHRAVLASRMTPFDQPYQDLLAQYTQHLQAAGQTVESARQAAQGVINQTLTEQAAILAYSDLFAIAAVAALCVVPITFLFGNIRLGGGKAGGH